MNTEPLKIIQAERVKTLLACYGADPHAWPADERSAALALLNHSPELRVQWQEARDLDELLHTGHKRQDVPLANAALVSQIVEHLPAQDSSSDISQHNVADKLRPQAHRHWPLAAAAAVLLFVVTFALQVESPLPQTQNQQLSSLEYEQWLWEDITGETIAADTNDSDDDTSNSINSANNELNFMTLVELEG